MFEIGRFFRFWRRFLGTHSVLLGIILILAVVTELILGAAPLASLAFWIAVGLDVMPAIGVGLIVLWLTSRFMQATYGLDSKRDGLQFLFRSRFGRPRFGPFMKIDQGQISINANGALNRIGGPGGLIVGKDSAVVLEQCGRFTRIEGHGFPNLDRFERVYDAVDLRPKRGAPEVQAMTKEGIPITWKVEVQYKIADGDHQPNDKTPYPFLKDAVFRAVTCKRKHIVDGRVEIIDWEKLVLKLTGAILRSILANYSLSQLIGLTTVKTRPVREEIQKKLDQTLREKVRELGVKILDVKLNNLQVNDPVTQQWINDWQTRWQQVFSSRPRKTAGAALAETVQNEAWRLLHTTLYRELEKQDPGQAITFMALTHLFFNLEGRLRSEAAPQLFMSNQVLGIRAGKQGEGVLGVSRPDFLAKPLEEDGNDPGKIELSLESEGAKNDGY